jgi:hypothetical protein
MIMNTPTGHFPLTTTGPEQVMARAASPVPAQAGAPEALAAPATQSMTGATEELPPAEPRDLAAEARQQHSERLSRDLFIEVSSQLALRVRHPDGGDSTVEEILAQEKAQREEIDRETAAGSRKHRRLPPWLRSIPRYVLAFDFGLLLYFFSGITNVDWSSPLSLSLAFALALAAMVTVLSYGFLSFTGHRLRHHKNDAGTIFHEEVDALTIASFITALVVIVVLAVLMFTRIRTEVLYALGSLAGVTALVIAVAVGVVSAAANVLVIAVHALDGSDHTARLDRLSAAVRKPLAKAHQLRKQAAKQVNH